MRKITEIVFGNSIYVTMLNSNLNNNEIIKFNTVFSLGNLSDIDKFKIYIPKDIYEEDNVYDFSSQMNDLNDSIKNNNKIRVWCSYKDSDSYILLTFVCNYLKDINVDLYVVYSDDYDSKCHSPSMLREEELEKSTTYERKLSKEEILKLSDIWNKVKDEDSDMRIVCGDKIKLVSYDYFDNIILDELRELGEVKEVELVSKLLYKFHLVDLIFVYLIDRLIKNGKIVITKKSSDEREFNNIIKIK